MVVGEALMRLYSHSEVQESSQSIYQNPSLVLRGLLPSALIEHIGSTAIPGAVSKGDLDIYVEVPQADFASSLAVIQSVGFVIKEGSLRTSSLCMLESTEHQAVAIQLVL